MDIRRIFLCGDAVMAEGGLPAMVIVAFADGGRPRPRVAKSGAVLPRGQT